MVMGWGGQSNLEDAQIGQEMVGKALRSRRAFFLNECLGATGVQCLWRPEEEAESPRTGVTDGCKQPCGCLSARETSALNH